MTATARTEVKHYGAQIDALCDLGRRGHGLYTWGRDLDEARRHVEILEFLFEVLIERSRYAAALAMSMQTQSSDT